MKRISAILATVGLLCWGASCNQHSWEDKDGKPGTKRFFEEHGHHGEDHGDGHGKADAHGKDADGEKKAH